MKLLALLHPPLLALGMVLSTTTRNLHRVYLEQIVYAGIVAVAVAGALTALLVYLLKKPGKASLTASVLIAVGFTYGILYDRLLDEHYEFSAYTLHVLTAAPAAATPSCAAVSTCNV